MRSIPRPHPDAFVTSDIQTDISISTPMEPEEIIQHRRKREAGGKTGDICYSNPLHFDGCLSNVFYIEYTPGLASAVKKKLLLSRNTMREFERKAQRKCWKHTRISYSKSSKIHRNQGWLNQPGPYSN
jgi:hypothetical protein